LADALARKSMRGLLLRTAILDEVGQFRIRGLLNLVGRELRRSHLYSGGRSFAIGSVASGALRLIEIGLRPRETWQNEKEGKCNHKNGKYDFLHHFSRTGYVVPRTVMLAASMSRQ